ncbi:MAG: DNA-processing protein DprA [Pseudohongiellaceae bacterium]
MSNTATTPQATTALLALMKLDGFGRRSALKIVFDLTGEADLSSCRNIPLPYVWQFNRKYESTTELEEALGDAWAKSEEQINQSQDDGIKVLSIYDAEYPERLKEIPDPPAVLFVKGSIDGLSAARSLAVVGTREPTKCGATLAQQYAHTAAEAGVVIVSGLAYGCDVYAHEGCLQKNKRVGVAVLAHGLDQVHPTKNHDLAERLLKNGGCLVSEYPIGVKPTRLAFAERNRIQSGLSDAVLVIETDVKGGTWNIIKYAHKQNRPLACVAHLKDLLTEDKIRGNRKLIEERLARPIKNEKELLQFLNETRPVITSETTGTQESAFRKQQLKMGL